MPIDTCRTYYWRTGTLSEHDTSWTVSSFISRTGLTGWEQSHFEQLDDNTFKFINIDAENRKFSFAPAARTIRCHNIGSPNSSNYMQLGYSMDQYSQYSSCGAANALLLVVIDSFSLDPWQSNMASYGQSNYPHCTSNEYENYFIFYLSSLDNALNNLINMINNDVPNGNYFMIYSFISGRFQQWPDSAYSAFESWGAEQVRNLSNNVPYIFFSRKGHPDEAAEVYGSSATDQIDFSRTMYTSNNHGTIMSTEIGPSRQWELLTWSADADSTDQYHLNILGVEPDGSTTLLIDSLTADTIDISDISAATYNKLRLQMYTSDNIERTPAQLRSWQVRFTPCTDLAIDAQHGWQFVSDTLIEGQQGRATAAFQNIGSEPSDSLLVHYWIQTAENQISDIGYHRLRPLQAGEYLIDTVSFPTLELSSDNIFYIELNPMRQGTSVYDQPELTHLNNFVQKPFSVVRDNCNPLMDVTIDGRHITDGELVSATPRVVVRVADDNAYLPLNSADMLSVYITDLHSGIEQKIISDSSHTISFSPGSTADNVAQLQIDMRLTSGVYQLRVRSHDASGNESGTDDYLISFEVMEESTISEVYAYPNPFSNDTRFGFILTGSGLPDEFRIEISNINGLVVKTITINDIDNLRIGQNLTAYTWDGSNQHGAQLPSGVYFYKVTARISESVHILTMQQWIHFPVHILGDGCPLGVHVEHHK